MKKSSTEKLYNLLKSTTFVLIIFSLRLYFENFKIYVQIAQVVVPIRNKIKH
jgi:hypothetical protein